MGPPSFSHHLPPRWGWISVVGKLLGHAYLTSLYPDDHDTESAVSPDEVLDSNVLVSHLDDEPDWKFSDPTVFGLASCGPIGVNFGRSFGVCPAARHNIPPSVPNESEITVSRVQASGNDTVLECPVSYPEWKLVSRATWIGKLELHPISRLTLTQTFCRPLEDLTLLQRFCHLQRRQETEASTDIFKVKFTRADAESAWALMQSMIQLPMYQNQLCNGRVLCCNNHVLQISEEANNVRDGDGRWVVYLPVRI